MSRLDALLNWLVPTIVLLGFAALLYSKMKNPIDQFFHWIGAGLRSMFDRGKDKGAEVYETTYRYG